MLSYVNKSFQRQTGNTYTFMQFLPNPVQAMMHNNHTQCGLFPPYLKLEYICFNNYFGIGKLKNNGQIFCKTRFVNKSKIKNNFTLLSNLKIA